MGKRTRLGALAIALGFLAAPFVGTVSAQATPEPPVLITSYIQDHPDDGCAPWARDEFQRTTTIAKTATAGVYKVKITDNGSGVDASGGFTTKKGANAPNGGVIANKVLGSINGSGEYLVTGKLRQPLDLAMNFNGKTFNRSYAACKVNLLAKDQTANWPLQFFETTPVAPTTTGIKKWVWNYATSCEFMKQSEAGGISGNILGLKCVKPIAPVLIQPTCEKPDLKLGANITPVAGITHDIKLVHGKVIVTAKAKPGYAFPFKTVDRWVLIPKKLNCPTASASPTTSSSPSASASPTTSPTTKPSTTSSPSVTPVATVPAPNNGTGGGSTDGDTLPVTGTSLGIVLVGGALLIALGIGFVAMGQRRKRKLAL